jgi:hypothetical protein
MQMQSTPLPLSCKPITSNQIAPTKLDFNDITQSKMTIRRAQTYSAQSSSTAKWDRPLSFSFIRTRSIRNDNLGLARMCHSLLHFTYVGLLGFHCRTGEIILRHVRHDRSTDWMQKQKDKHICFTISRSEWNSRKNDIHHGAKSVRQMRVHELVWRFKREWTSAVVCVCLVWPSDEPVFMKLHLKWPFTKTLCKNGSIPNRKHSILM